MIRGYKAVEEINCKKDTYEIEKMRGKLHFVIDTGKNLQRSKKVKLVRKPISLGIFPVSWFSPKSKSFKVVNRPSSVGKMSAILVLAGRENKEIRASSPSSKGINRDDSE
jgi:hypothetical protein